MKDEQKDDVAYLHVTSTSLRFPKDPPDDFRMEIEDARFYALAYGMVRAISMGGPDWGEPVRITFQSGALIECRLPTGLSTGSDAEDDATSPAGAE